MLLALGRIDIIPIKLDMLERKKHDPFVSNRSKQYTFVYTE